MNLLIWQWSIVWLIWYHSCKEDLYWLSLPNGVFCAYMTGLCITSQMLWDRETRVPSILLFYKKYWKLHHGVNQQNKRQSCWGTKPPTGFRCLKSLVDTECAKVTCSVVFHTKTRCVSSVPWLTIFCEYHAISTDVTDTLLDDISSQPINKCYLQNKI